MNSGSYLFFALVFPGIPFLILYGYLWLFDHRRKQTRRPFDQMRRPPGYSIRERSDDAFVELNCRILVVVMVALFPFFFFIAFGEKYLVPLIVSGAAAAGITIWRVFRQIESLIRLRLGVLGEEAVGAELNALGGEGIIVFHDLIIAHPSGATENIDHVILTKAGLIAVETKARRKKKRDGKKGARIIYSGDALIFPNGVRSTSELEQIERTSTWLSREATRWTRGTRIPVIPVVTFPGWWIERRGQGEVKVLNHKEFASLLGVQRRLLSDTVWHDLRRSLESHSLITFDGKESPSPAKIHRRVWAAKRPVPAGVSSERVP